MTRRSVHSEDGWVLASAIVLMAIMLSIGISAFAFVDTNQQRSRESRERESSLSLAEAALYAQGFALTKNWPNATNSGLSGDCSSTQALTATTQYCPDRDTLDKASSANKSVAQFSNTDFGANTSWSTSVRDNYGSLASSYNPATADQTLTENGVSCPQTPCRMDFNGDRQVWVQARAVVRGRPRNIVARLKLEQLSESVPQAGVVAGRMDVTNSGSKVLLDASGSSILLRCTPVTSNSCANYQPSKNQVTPTPASAGSQPNFMTPSQIQRFKERAQTEGTYYPAGTCPTGAQLQGAVVFVERCSTSYSTTGAYSTPCVVPGDMSTNCINPTNKPGLLIWHCGTFAMTAGQTYYGIVYMVNNSDGTCSGWTAKSGPCSTTGTIYETNGGGGVYGALMVDGDACIRIGSNSLNLGFDKNVFNGVSSFGTVGLVQNTWRELKAG